MWQRTGPSGWFVCTVRNLQLPYRVLNFLIGSVTTTLSKNVFQDFS